MRPQIKIERRESTPAWLGFATPIITILASLVVGWIILAITGADPINAYRVILIDPLLAIDSWIGIFERTIPLVLTGLAVYIPLKAGLWNIGAEGQLYVGAIIGTVLGLHITAPSYILLPMMILLSGVMGALWGLIPGYLRAKWNVNEIIVSLLMSFIAIRITDYLVGGPLKGDRGFPATNSLPDAATIPTFGEVFTILEAIDLHIGSILVVVIIIAASIMMGRTSLGFQIRFVGENPLAAEQGGIERSKIIILTMVMGGLIAGIAGIIEIAGVQNNLQSGFSPDYGFTAIPIALLGRNGPSRVLLASLFFGLLFVGSSTAAATLDIQRTILNVLQALIILFLLATEFTKDHKISIDFTNKGTGGIN
jgi:simple sugar transport system permease protein